MASEGATPDIESLLARIAALEIENEKLRDKDETKEINTELLSLPTKFFSGDAQSSGGRQRRESNVYFDGYRTRVSCFAKKEPEKILPLDPLNGIKEGIPDRKQDDEKDLSDGDLDSYLAQTFGGGGALGETDSTNANSSSRPSVLMSSSESIVKPQDSSRRVSFHTNLEQLPGKRDGSSDDGEDNDNMEFSSVGDDQTESSEFTQGTGPFAANRRASYAGSEAGDSAKDIISDRRAKMSQARSWRSGLSRSVSGDSVYGLSDDGWNKDSLVHFTLGREKKNRYSIDSLEDIVEALRRRSNSEAQSDEKTIQREINETGESVSAIPLLDQKFASDQIILDIKDAAPTLSEGKQYTSDKLAPMDQDTLKSMAMFVKLSAMTKVLSKESSTTPVMEATAFRQFHLLGVDPETASKDGAVWEDAGGKNFLDPFIIKTANCIDSYPPDVKDENLDPNALSTFCFQDGISVRLLPQAAREGAIRLGLVGKKADEYKLLAFTDGNGVTTHGVALCICEEANSDSPGVDNLIQKLQNYRLKRVAAGKICRWWRSVSSGIHVQGEEESPSTPVLKQRKRDKIAKTVKKAIPKAVQSKLKQSKNPVNDTNDKREFSRKESGDSNSRSLTGMFKKKASFNQKECGIRSSLKKISSRNGKKAEDDMITDNAEETVENTLGDTELDQLNESISENSLSLSEHARRLGKEIFRKMQAPSGDICIVQKCYVLIGGTQQEQFLQLRSLQHLVDMERATEENDGESSKDTEQDNKGLGIFNGNHILRHKFLSFVQKCMLLSPTQSCIQLPASDFDMVMQSPPTFDIDLPAFNGNSKVSIPLPLPQISADFGVATLLQRIKADALIGVLHLILIERPILVLGDSADIVTSCTCALLDLIQPFTWSSNFIPLLPREMLEFCNSPVPFITAMVATKKESKSIEEDIRITEAMSEGLSVVNLSSGKVRTTTETGIGSMIKSCPAPRKVLVRYKTRLEALRESDPSLCSLAAFLNQGFSRRTLVTVRAVRSLIKAHLESFSGDIASDWRKYGNFESGTDEFDFYPSMFIEPLRRKLENQLQIQEMMAHSQLFVEYVDGRRKLYLTKKELAKRDDVGKFLALWIWCRWQIKKRAK